MKGIFSKSLSAFVLVIIMLLHVVGSSPVFGQSSIAGSAGTVERVETIESVESVESIETELLPTSVFDSVYLQNRLMQLAAASDTLTIYPGETYEFTNDSSLAKSLSHDGSKAKGNYIDYVSYRATGAIYADNIDSVNTPIVQPEGVTYVTAVGISPITITIKDPVMYAASPNPAMERYSLDMGESYRIVNEGNSGHSISSDAASASNMLYDYAIYENNGKLGSSRLESTSKPRLYDGDELIITGASSMPVTVAFPYGYFTAEPSTEPAYQRVTLHMGESHRFTNESDQSITLESTGTTKDRFDFAVYYPDGTEANSRRDTYTKPPIAAGRYIVITQVTATPVTFGVPYRIFDSGDRTGEAISQAELRPEESYRFTNTGSRSNPIKNNASKIGGWFDYAVYDEDDTLKSKGFNQRTKPSIPAGGYAIVTVAGTVPIKFDYTDDFTAEESGEPAFIRVTLSKGESYEFINISEKRARLDSDSRSSNPERRMDYVTYYEDGTERSRGMSTTRNALVMPDNLVSVTGVTSTPITIGAVYTLFAEQHRSNEAITRITIQPGESYIFNNNGSRLNPIINNSRQVGSSFNYAMYRADGKLAAHGMNMNTSPNVPAGGEAVVSVTGSRAIVFDYTDDFTATPSLEPAYIRVTLTQGESYSYTNVSSQTAYLRANTSASQDRRYGYVIYDASGKERSSNTRTTFKPGVRAGEKITVTTVTTNPVTFGGVYRIFKGQDSDNGLQRLTLMPGESAVFRNTGTDAYTLDHNAAKAGTKLDYASYRPNGTVQTDGFGVTAKPSILGGGEAVVTNIAGNPVQFTYTDRIQAAPSAEPAFHRMTIQQHEGYQFMNISSQDKTLDKDSLPAARWSYTNYRADGTEASKSTETISLPSVHAGGKAVVHTVSQTPAVIGAVYRLFQVEPVAIDGPEPQPENGQITLRQGQSYKFTVAGSEQAVLKSNGTAGTRLFDYAAYTARTDNSLQAGIIGMNQPGTSLSLNAGQFIIVTVTSAMPVTFQYGEDLVAEPSTEPALRKIALSAGKQVIFTSTSPYSASLLAAVQVPGTGLLYEARITDAQGKIIRESATQVSDRQEVPAQGSAKLRSTGTGVAFGAPYLVFNMQEVVTGDLIELIELVEKKADFGPSAQGLYYFTPLQTGRYRFAVRESSNPDQEPMISLYEDATMSKLLVSSSQLEQLYGRDYTVLEWELQAGQTVYVKLEEKNKGALTTVIKAALMPVGIDTTYQYGKGNRLESTTLYTGDQIQLEYDRNGNVIKRTKKIFPF